MVNFLNQTTIPVVIRPARNIGGIAANVTLEEISTDELTITQHPVQQGASITDHAFKNPTVVSIRALYGDNLQPLSEIYQQLLQLQSSREPFDVVTGKRTYTNMLFKTLGQTTDQATENILAINATLQEIIIVSVEVTSVPARAKQANPGKTAGTESAGNKAAQTTNDATAVKVQKQSALDTLVNGGL